MVGFLAAALTQCFAAWKEGATLIAMQPDKEKLRALAGELASVLTMFHKRYETDPVGRNTEYRRGMVTGWRQALHSTYGERAAQEIVEAASLEAGYTIPH